MRHFVLLLVWALSAFASANAGGEELQSVLDRHMREEVAYWLDEPRLLELFHEAGKRNATLPDDELVRMEARWREEVAGEGGDLSDVVASRFGSKYLAEVALRLDGAYGPVLALDNRGLVLAASDLPEQWRFADDVCVSRLAQRADAAWVQDRKPVSGAYTRVALPVKGGDGERIGVLLLDIDVARLARMGSLRDDQTRLTPDATTSAHDGSNPSPRLLPGVPRG